MTTPVSGQTLTGAYVYQVLLGVNVGTLLGVTAAYRLTAVSGSTVTFGTDPANPGVETITFTTEVGGNTFTQDISTSGDSQSPTAFTYTSGGVTYIVSNGPVSAPIADLTLGPLTALVGGLGDLGLTPGSNAYIACYVPGTRIATPDGDRPIEELAIGDDVLTLSGAMPIRWIGRRSYSGAFIEGNRNVLPVCIRAGALGQGMPRRDLYVSPLHAMFLGGVLVPARMLVNGISVIQARSVQDVSYIHIELDSHQIILAEGAPSESFVDDNSRAMFHNAHEFARLYPDQVAVPAVYFASRVEDGEALAALRDVIDHRAGLPVPALRQGLRGRVDEIEGRYVTGWAQNPDQPEAPVCLELVVGGTVVGRTLANRLRADLRGAGLGSGRHAFRAAVPDDVLAADGAVIELRRAADHASLGAVAVSTPAEAIAA